jgi:hypothetical protein
MDAGVIAAIIAGSLSVVVIGTLVIVQKIYPVKPRYSLLPHEVEDGAVVMADTGQRPKTMPAYPDEFEASPSAEGDSGFYNNWSGGKRRKTKRKLQRKKKSRK